MRTRFWTASLLVLSGMIFISGKPTAQKPAADAGEAERFARRVVTLINAQREAFNLPPLKLQPNLTDSARWMAQDMADHNYFRHTDKMGREVGERVPEFGYKNWRLLAENIAAGQRTPEEVVAVWMKSPGHRSNILNPNLREIGVAYYMRPDSDYHSYWVEDFGTRFEVFPVVINNEEAQTTSPSVRLRIYGEGWAERMRLSGDGEHWTEWEAFSAERNWMLEEGMGTRMVIVELRHADEILRSSDSIELASSPAPVAQAKPSP